MLKTFLILFFLTSAHAQVIFDGITYQGSGCPQGTVSTIVSPDGSTFSILFGEFRAEVPQYDGRNDNTQMTGRRRAATRNTTSLSFKNCQLSFTATLPEGMSADSLHIELQARGATILDQGVIGSFTSFLVGHSGLSNSRGMPMMVIQKFWTGTQGPVDDSWTAAPANNVALRSSCARGQNRSVKFELKNHIQAEILDGDLKKSGMITVDSADAGGMLKFTLATSRCRMGGGNMLPPRRHLGPVIRSRLLNSFI